MVRIHCRHLHDTGQSPCSDCAELLDYAWLRLDRCPFRGDKPTCTQCTIHCYRPAMREKIKAVMRYAGPRMLLRHPVLAIGHLLDGRRKRPVPVSPRQDRR
jgi:hypothetical protein